MAEMKPFNAWAVICSETYAPIVQPTRYGAQCEAEFMRGLRDSGKVTIIPVVVSPRKRRKR